jgi:hypothetical protein
MANQETNNKNEDKKYPGYPHYPDSEDALRNIKVDDEERDPEDDIVMGSEADVSKQDIELLDHAEENMNTPDDINLIRSGLDNTDADGEPLNEESDGDYAGGELDVPGSDLDDMDEKIGEEDEENNYYSLGGDDKENLEEDNQ